MSITVRVKKGRMLTIRQIDSDKAQVSSVRDFSVERRPEFSPKPKFSKAKKKFSAKKNPQKGDATKGNRVGDIKRLDKRDRLTPEERITRLIELADRYGTEYLENEKQIHQRKVFEIEEALRRHVNARVERGLQKMAEQIEKELNPGEPGFGIERMLK